MATEFNTQVGNGEYRLRFETDNREYYLLMQETARRCVDGKPVTNADRIRAMSDEELAQMLTIGQGGFDCSTCVETTDYRDCEQNCEERCLKWLQQPPKEE